MDGLSVDELSKIAARRQIVARAIHGIWTEDGSYPSGLADKLLDGRIDLIGEYTMLADFHAAIDPSERSFSRCGPRAIPSRDCGTLSVDQFRSQYMFPNLPVMITGLTASWKANEWLGASPLPTPAAQAAAMQPDMDEMELQFGPEIVPVHEQLSSGFTLPRPLVNEMTFSEYAAWWRKHQHDQHNPPRDNGDAVPSSSVQEHGDVDCDQTLLYLKDWKFVATHPSLRAYEWPKYFRDDWLNGAMGSAYKFIYLGPKGTSTRLHADVLQSFSWSTNVCGRKRWYLIPPECTYLLMDCFGQHLAPHLHADLDLGLECLYPGLKHARMQAMEVIQEAGETIFVPSKWHHTVENIADTLSINHNWLNGANIRHSWDKLKKELLSYDCQPIGSDVVGNGSADGQLNGIGDSTKTNTNTNGQTAPSDSTGAKDTSQAADDLVLLWIVVSKKAEHILAQSGGSVDDSSSNDLKQILLILRGIQDVMQQGKDQGLSGRCRVDLEPLMHTVEDALSLAEASE